MKYIRTKDGIRKIVGENHILKSVSYYNTRRNLCSYRTETNRYKIADTIEELIDEYVIKGEFGIYTVGLDELDRHAMGQTKEMLLNGQLEAYGAIWIVGENDEPILNSVAKVNGKGVLELL